MSSLRRPLLAALVLALLIPASAHASSGTKDQAYRFQTRADGYRVVVFAHDSTLLLGVTHNETARRAGAATYYFARARTRGGKITSRIGSLGSISMSFHPSGPERLDQHHCDSGLTRSRPGAFVGALRFRGEDGYVDLNAHRLKGIELRDGHACNPAAAQRLEESGKFDRLSVGYRSGLDATYFSAFTLPSRGSYYYAVTEAGGNDYGVEREAFAAAPESTFATDLSLSFADVTPPFPFSGTGSLRRAADGAPLWSGSLAVSFPGAPSFPLTGPLFKTQLTRSW